MTPDEVFDEEIGSEIQVRIRTWKAERATLEKAAIRIAELDALIAHAEEQAAPVEFRRTARKDREEAIAKAAEEKVK